MPQKASSASDVEEGRLKAKAKAKEVNVREEVWQRDTDLYGAMKEQEIIVRLLPSRFLVPGLTQPQMTDLLTHRRDRPGSLLSSWPMVALVSFT